MDTNTTQGGQEPPQEGSTDLSTRTVVTLVVLTLVVSFLGAWMNVNQALTIGPASVAPDQVSSGSSTAKVSFGIAPPAHDASTGLVSFELRPPTTP